MFISCQDALSPALNCAGEKNRTPDYCLEGSRFTTKLHPQARKNRKLAYIFLPSAADEPLGTPASESHDSSIKRLEYNFDILEVWVHLL